MEVNIFKESAIGYKNILKSSYSQDFSIYKKYENYIILVVADGHSMNRFKYSHIGSKLACKAALNIMENYLCGENIDKKINLLINDLKSGNFQKKIKTEWRKLVYEDFYKKNYKVYKLDFALYGTTLTFGILLEENIIFFNLGDGIILIKEGEDYKNVFKNNNFKIVNSLSQNDCEEKMQYKILKIDRLPQLVISTDGFIDSFKNYEQLKLELDTIFEELNKNVFSCLNLKKAYRNHLNDLSKYGSHDDMSIIFVYS